MGLLDHLRSGLCIALFLLIGFSMNGYAEAADVKVVVKQGTRAFLPQEITIKLGDKVTWVNQDQESHFVISAGPSSMQRVRDTEKLEINKLLLPGESYTYFFAEADIYSYFCAIHMEMWGR